MRAGAPVLQPLPRALEACVSSLILISLPNARNQRLATLDFLSGPSLSRVRCIALFAQSTLVDRLFMEHRVDHFLA